ncbi:unnamed protein product, partial [Pocillopora meandrina]
MHKNYPNAISKDEEKNLTEVALCKSADAVLAVGQKLADALSTQLCSCKSEDDILQLTPGTFHEFSDVKQTLKERNKFKVLTFGRGDPEDFSLKGYNISARALAELKDRSYHLIFVGAPDGKQDEVAKNLLKSGIDKDQLTVRKLVRSKERLKELFCEVDLYIMPSRTEGFGLTALEALSAGLPILISENSGFGEALCTVPSGKSFVVESEDPQEWAKAIAGVRQKERSNQLQDIQLLRSLYEEKFSWEKQCDSLVEKMWDIVHDENVLNILQKVFQGATRLSQLNRVFTLKSTKCQRFITRRRSEILTPSVQTRQQPRETSLRNPGVKGATETSVDSNEWNILHFAAQGSDPDTIDLIHTHLLNIESKTGGGWTPLMVAAVNSKLHALQWFLEKGAIVTCEDIRGWNSLHMAALGGDTDITDLIHTHLPNTESKTGEGCTALMAAALCGKLHAVKWFLEKGATVTS